MSRGTPTKRLQKLKGATMTGQNPVRLSIKTLDVGGGGGGTRF